MFLVPRLLMVHHYNLDKNVVPALDRHIERANKSLKAKDRLLSDYEEQLRLMDSQLEAMDGQLVIEQDYAEMVKRRNTDLEHAFKRERRIKNRWRFLSIFAAAAAAGAVLL